MAGIIDENNDEPTVQARHTYNNVVNPITNSIGSTTVHAHKVPSQVSPFELGMYTLLAALCFAIVAFVISCVVYASKYKQNSLEMPTTTLMSKNRLFVVLYFECTDANLPRKIGLRMTYLYEIKKFAGHSQVQLYRLRWIYICFQIVIFYFIIIPKKYLLLCFFFSKIVHG